MPINLLKLPSLVGAMVVTELDYQEIFLLSKCSRRSIRLVKKARITVPKLTFRLEKCDAYDSFVIGVKIAMYDWYYVTSVIHVPKLKLEGVANANPVLDDESDIESWYVEVPVYDEKTPDYDEEDPDYDEEDPGHVVASFRHRIKRTSEPMEVQKETQNHVNSIFHYSGPYKLYLSMECEGQLPNITNVKHIVIEDGTIDEQFLTKLLTTYPDFHTLESSIVGELPKDSPFFQIQNIAVHSRCGPDYFHNFAGRHLWLDSVTVTDQDVIRFLHKWISNEAYHNLETAIISVAHPLSINADVIRQAIEFEEYDPNEPEKRPENYVCAAPFDDFMTIEEFPLRKENVVEVRQVTDGKRAYLSIDDSRVEFLVHKYQLDDSYDFS